jgi:two-component system, cell cycle sensor histidine kinase and response regulator CckA
VKTALVRLWQDAVSVGVLAPRAGLLLGLGSALALFGLLLGDGPARDRLLASGLALVLTSVVLRGPVALRALSGRLAERLMLRTVMRDPVPCFCTDTRGSVVFQNPAAGPFVSGPADQTLTAILSMHFANPGVVLHRLQARAQRLGSATEDVATRSGHLRVSVHQALAGRFLWRVQDMAPKTCGTGASSLPMLVANAAGVVLFANGAMRRLLGERPRQLDAIFDGAPGRHGEEVRISGCDGPVRALFAEVPGQGGRSEVYLVPLGDPRPQDMPAGDIEHVPVPLMRFAPDGALIDSNRAARDLTGLAPDVAIMMHDLFDGLGRPVSEWLGDVIHERNPGGSEVLALRLGGDDSDRFFQVTLRRVVDNGKLGVLAVLQDATALKRLEAQFLQSHKMQAIGQLAGGIAHDFNNLLTAISGHCDLLMLRHTHEDPDYADLAQIHQNANRAAAVVGQLLAFSRKQTLKPERIDLQDALADLTHLLNRLVGERIRLQLIHAADLGPIRADRRQLEQVIMNLVVNARDAMPNGGLIRIETVGKTLAEPMHRDHAIVPEGRYSVIKVKDNGEGIQAVHLEKIFEPFFTTKRAGEGTGLGLSMVYGIVKQSGGFIFVDSSPDDGSEFQLWFPENNQCDSVVAPVHRPASVSHRHGDGVVLLVEDEGSVRAFASRALRLRGFTVIEANSGEAALAVLQDPAAQVDVFVTDVVMPGLDGPSWVSRALEDRPNTPVIFVSGYAEDGLSEDQARIPNSIFLPKPFSLNDLIATVQRQLSP